MITISLYSPFFPWSCQLASLEQTGHDFFPDPQKNKYHNSNNMISALPSCSNLAFLLWLIALLLGDIMNGMIRPTKAFVIVHDSSQTQKEDENEDIMKSHVVDDVLLHHVRNNHNKKNEFIEKVVKQGGAFKQPIIAFQLDPVLAKATHNVDIQKIDSNIGNANDSNNWDNSNVNSNAILAISESKSTMTNNDVKGISTIHHHRRSKQSIVANINKNVSSDEEGRTIRRKL